MRRRVKHLVHIERPFAMFFEPSSDGQGWIGHVVGQELDQVTCAENPSDVVFMAADVVRMLTGMCQPMDATPHDWSIETTLDMPDAPEGSGEPAWQCSRCGEKCIKTDFEEVVEH